MGHEHEGNKHVYMHNPVPYVTAVIILTVLGVASNVLLLWVWLGEKRFRVSSFLFKYLATCDILYLFSFPFSLGTNFGPTEVTLEERGSVVGHHLSDLGQMMSVHTTLLICLSRWMAVAYPFRAKALLLANRIYVACFSVFCWCLLVQFGDVFWAQHHDHDHLHLSNRKGSHPDLGQNDHSHHDHDHINLSSREGSHHDHSHHDHSQTGHSRHEHVHADTFHQAKRIVGFVSPCMVMFVFSMCLLRAFFQHKEKINRISSSVNLNITRRNRRLIIPVVIISFTTFLAYPVSDTILIITTRALHCQSIFSNKFSFIGYFLQMFNSSINVYVYWGTSSRFRQLVKIRVISKKQASTRSRQTGRIVPAVSTVTTVRQLPSHLRQIRARGSQTCSRIPHLDSSAASSAVTLSEGGQPSARTPSVSFQTPIVSPPKQNDGWARS